MPFGLNRLAAVVLLAALAACSPAPDPLTD